MSTPLAELRDVSCTRQGRSVLEHVSLAIHEGEIVSLIGPNGGGKTTLVRVLLGLAKPAQGSVLRRPDLRAGYMPQRFQVDPNLPISSERFLRVAVNDRAAVAQALQRAGAQHLAHAPLQGLSGGEFQRVLLARALLRQPNLLVMDEPAQGVDIKGQAGFYRLIAQLREETGCGVLLVSHDLHLVMANSDRVTCLNQHVCCEGTPAAVTTNPAYLELFGEHDLRGIGIYTHHHDHHHDLHGDAVPDPCAGHHHP